jgi:two-component system, chemotaxis family, sensor kinase Cph1
VIRNLLDNAIRYTPVGGLVEVVVDETADEIIVRVLDRGRHASDRDDGSALAIRPRERPRTTAQRSGAGLRLHVAGRLASAMGGRVWARPREGDGSEFGFALPRTA